MLNTERVLARMLTGIDAAKPDIFWGAATAAYQVSARIKPLIPTVLRPCALKPDILWGTATAAAGERPH